MTFGSSAQRPRAEHSAANFAAPTEGVAMGEKETAERASTAGADSDAGDGPDDPEQRIKAGLESAGGMLASGAARRSVGSGSEEQRLSTNMTIERQTPKRDFGD